MIKQLIQSQLVCPDLERKYPKITHGKGVWLFDQEGNKYLDGSAGTCAVSNIGHGVEGIAEVLHNQVSKIAVQPAHLLSSDIVEAYLEKLVGFAPEGFAKAWTVSSGTEAVESAIKLAFQYQQIVGNKEKHKIISRWGTYHGNTIFALDVGGLKGRREFYEVFMNNFPHIDPAFPYRKPEEMTMEEYSKHCSNQLEETILKEGADTVAAFIAEPVVAAALGAVAPPEGYFKEIRRICDKYDVVFIVDEVLAGFGRTGKNFSIENFEVTPDIIACAKGISAGFFPLSAVIAHENITKAFTDNNQHFFSGHTYSCVPLGAAVGNFVIDYLEENNVVENSRLMGEYLHQKLVKLKEKHDCIGDVRGLGLLRAVEFVKNRETKEPFADQLVLAKKIVERSLDKGVVLYAIKGTVDYKSGDHILITPPLTINESELDILVEVLDESIYEIIKENL